MSDSVRPHRRQPTRLPCPWDSPGKNTRVGCHFLPQCMEVKSESEVTQSCPTLSDPTGSLPGFSVHWQVSPLLLTPPGKPIFLVCYFTLFQPASGTKMQHFKGLISDYSYFPLEMFSNSVLGRRGRNTKCASLPWSRSAGAPCQRGWVVFLGTSKPVGQCSF